jgi:(4S)-4-hydroxy-5-phosphonooxypentane-2,3-dione isomerase
MLIQSVHYTVASEDAEKAAAILRELRAASRSEPGVIAFEVARSSENPNEFALYEAYQDEAARDAHAKTEHFATFVINGIRKLAVARNAVIGAPI